MQHNISNAIHCYLHDIRAALAPALCKYSLCKYSLCKHSCHSLPTDFLTSSTPELNCHVWHECPAVTTVGDKKPGTFRHLDSSVDKQESVFFGGCYPDSANSGVRW